MGDRAQTLENALQAMEKQGIQVHDVSGLYESEPMYLEEQPEFLNAVCKVVLSLYIELTTGADDTVTAGFTCHAKADRS